MTRAHRLVSSHTSAEDSVHFGRPRDLENYVKPAVNLSVGAHMSDAPTMQIWKRQVSNLQR